MTVPGAVPPRLKPRTYQEEPYRSAERAAPPKAWEVADKSVRKIDQIRASKLPSNMMQFAARGALQVSPAENVEILVYLARHNKVFGDLARMTLAGWDEKISLAVASDPQSPAEVLDYMISPDNVRPKLLPALLENPAVPEAKVAKFAVSATRESIEILLKSERVRTLRSVLSVLKSNPYVRKEEGVEIGKRLSAGQAGSDPAVANQSATPGADTVAAPPGEEGELAASGAAADAADDEEGVAVPDDTVSAYLTEHAGEITAEEGKPFQPIGGIVDLLGADYFPVSQVGEAPAEPTPEEAAAAAAKKRAHPPDEIVRKNTVQKISALDVKGRIQLALKGNKEERSLLIRDGTKVVALAVLEAPKLSDGEVEKFASQKNVQESVLRAIPLKRRFMKNYIVVRNLVANPRTPLDLGLGLMKNLQIKDLKNLSGNKEVSETIRNLAMKMFKQKLEAVNKK